MAFHGRVLEECQERKKKGISCGWIRIDRESDGQDEYSLLQRTEIAVGCEHIRENECRYDRSKFEAWTVGRLKDYLVPHVC